MNVEILNLSDNITFQRVMVTPELASVILQKSNMNNRDKKDKLVRKYANLMRKGQWHDNSPETICFAGNDCNSRLLNGQHRLSAVIEANKNVPMYFSYNVPEDNFKNLDTGYKRTISDAFKIYDIQNHKLASCVIGKYITYKNNPARKIGASSFAVSIEDVLIEYNKRPDFWQYIVEYAHKSNKKTSILEPSLIGSWFALAHDICEDDAKQYFEKLTTGVGVIDEKDPVNQYRNYLMKNKKEKHMRVVTSAVKHAMFIKSWNMYRERKLVTLTYSPMKEKFPSMN